MREGLTREGLALFSHLKKEKTIMIMMVVKTDDFTGVLIVLLLLSIAMDLNLVQDKRFVRAMHQEMDRV